MELTDAQIAEFHQQGYLFLPEQFTREEIAPLRKEADCVFALDRQEIWRETSGVARTAFAAHTYSEPFRATAKFATINEMAVSGRYRAFNMLTSSIGFIGCGYFVSDEP
jgi:ectoine hydroxylase